MRKTISLVFYMLFLTFIVAFGLGEATRRWPSGRYGLPNTIHGCPMSDAGLAWETGNITQALGRDSKASSSFHLKARINKKGVRRSFCIKNTDSSDPARPAWPAGRYCIYRKGGSCPVGLKAGSLMWNNRFDLFYTKSIGVVPDGRSTSSNTLVNFCCAVNGDKTTPIPLPLESPFFLLAYYSKTCQQVEGALHRAEFIYYNTDGQNRLTPPYPYGASDYNMNITYCYYQACRNNLTALNGTIMSPFYPSSYPNDADCRWQIQVPDDYAITLEFGEVDMEASIPCTKDWLQISTGSPETVVAKYCAKRIYPALETRSNVVVLEFHSDGVTTMNKGFRVHYRAEKIPVPLTTTSQPTVTMTTRSTTTTKTIPPTNTPTTSLPTQTTTESKPDRSTETNSPSTQQSTVMTTEGSEGLDTSPLTKLSRSSSPATPVVRGARKKDSGHRVWVIPVIVGLSILCLTVLLAVLYFKCLKKRNTIGRRHSTVKYNRKCSYVDMEIQSNEAFGVSSNPNVVLYDNYPGEDSGYSEPTPRTVQAPPVYEEIKDPAARSSEQGQRNNVYESMATMNDYQTPERTSRVAHVYESATLPLKK